MAKLTPLAPTALEPRRDDHTPAQEGIDTAALKTA